MLYSTYRSLFTWYDGPLVQAMKNGELFLIDEISLAGMYMAINILFHVLSLFTEDAVLERLNSVLEPNRLLVLAEKVTNKVVISVGVLTYFREELKLKS